MIRITSRNDGFMRCGIRHPGTPTDYPDDRFTKKELQILKAEPMLIVQEVEGDPEGEKKKTDPGGSKKKTAKK